MSFFAEFDAWLNALLVGYIGTNTTRIAEALEPAIVTMGVLYVMIWGYLHMTAKIEEPLLDGVKRIALLGIILGVSLHLWLYHAVVVDLFFEAPAQLAAILVGAGDPVATTDAILNGGTESAELLIRKGSILSGNFSFYVAGAVVYAIIGVTAIYSMFLLALSRIALSILLALGPLFFALLLFDSTRRFFEAWLAQLCNYAFITILTVLIAALMLHVVRAAAEHAVALGGDIRIADGVRVCLAAGLTLLVMRQVMPMAAGLASGLALSTFGVTSAAIGWALGSARRTTGEVTRGLFDKETTRWDSWRRKAGYYAGRGIAATSRGGAGLLSRGYRRLRPNQIRSS